LRVFVRWTRTALGILASPILEHNPVKSVDLSILDSSEGCTAKRTPREDRIDKARSPHSQIVESAPLKSASFEGPAKITMMDVLLVMEYRVVTLSSAYFAVATSRTWYLGRKNWGQRIFNSYP